MFNITKPNKFSNVQKKLKLWLTRITFNFRTYPTIFRIKKVIFVISYLDKTIFKWVQSRFEFFFLENDDKKQK